MESKYFCEKCQYKCNYQSEWVEHLKSKRHTGEKRKERCDKKLEEKNLLFIVKNVILDALQKFYINDILKHKNILNHKI